MRSTARKSLAQTVHSITIETNPAFTLRIRNFPGYHRRKLRARLRCFFILNAVNSCTLIKVRQLLSTETSTRDSANAGIDYAIKA